MRAAIKRNDPAALQKLLDRPRCLGLTSGNINVPLDGADGSALHMAAATASELLVRALLERGAQVNALNVSLETPLHLAAKRGSVPVLEALLGDAAIKIDALDRSGSSPLMHAASSGHWECARLLLAASASPSPAGSRADTECAAPLKRAEAALAACAALWPTSTVRYCAIGQLGTDEPLASCAPHSAPSGWADALSKAEMARGAEMLRRVMGSARIKEHPRLTVSTESGMLHYELQPQSQLLFLAITISDLPQSTAFTFLQQLRTRFVSLFEQRISSKSLHPHDPAASHLIKTLCATLPPQPRPATSRAPHGSWTRPCRSASITMTAQEAVLAAAALLNRVWRRRRWWPRLQRRRM